MVDARGVEAAQETMGVDQTLIEDGTYFLIEAQQDGQRVLAGCGGWGKRKTLYGGDHTAGNNDSWHTDETSAAACSKQHGRRGPKCA